MGAGASRSPATHVTTKPAPVNTASVTPATRTRRRRRSTAWVRQEGSRLVTCAPGGAGKRIEPGRRHPRRGQRRGRAWHAIASGRPTGWRSRSCDTAAWPCGEWGSSREGCKSGSQAGQVAGAGGAGDHQVPVTVAMARGAARSTPPTSCSGVLSAAGAGRAPADPLPRPAPQRRHAAARPRHPPQDRERDARPQPDRHHPGSILARHGYHAAGGGASLRRAAWQSGWQSGRSCRTLEAAHAPVAQWIEQRTSNP